MRILFPSTYTIIFDLVCKYCHLCYGDQNYRTDLRENVFKFNNGIAKKTIVTHIK